MRFAALATQIHSLLELLLPERCGACDAELAAPRVALCGSCLRCVEPIEARRLPDGLAVAPFRYAEPIASAVRAFKYANRPELARRFATSIVDALGQPASLGVHPDTVLVPVPLHPRRLAERGYNQAALLAQRLGQRLGCKVRPRALARLSDTEHQAALGREQRLHNMRSQIKARKAIHSDVILVDDVLTTGATAAACMAALTNAGAKPLGMLCIAIAL